MFALWIKEDLLLQQTGTVLCRLIHPLNCWCLPWQPVVFSICDFSTIAIHNAVTFQRLKVCTEIPRGVGGFLINIFKYFFKLSKVSYKKTKKKSFFISNLPYLYKSCSLDAFHLKNIWSIIISENTISVHLHHEWSNTMVVIVCRRIFVPL